MHLNSSKVLSVHWNNEELAPESDVNYVEKAKRSCDFEIVDWYIPLDAGVDFRDFYESSAHC